MYDHGQDFDYDYEASHTNPHETSHEFTYQPDTQTLTHNHRVAAKFLLASAAISGFMLGCIIMVWYHILA